jgi:hypothetical protein
LKEELGALCTKAAPRDSAKLSSGKAIGCGSELASCLVLRESLF